MKHLLSAGAWVMAIALMPSMAAANDYSSHNAHDNCKRDEDKRQVLGGLAGAVVGGVFGSQVSGNGARTEGSAIGAVLGGLAGAGIADKSIDCDPVYEDRSDGYPTSNYPSTTYPATTYPATSYPTTTYPAQASGTYSSASTYPAATTYPATNYGQSQEVYQDRVTYSDHPVYSDPNYGAGAIRQGTSYSAGTTSYPPAGNNSQYASRTYTGSSSSSSAPITASAPVTYSTQGARTYTASAPVYSTQGARTYAATQTYTAPVTPRYHTVSQPVSHTVSRPVTYTQPRYVNAVPVSSRVRRRGPHHHGRHACGMGH